MTTPEEQAAEVLERHRATGATKRLTQDECTCGAWVEDFNDHVAEALAPLFAEERRKGAEAALREAVDFLEAVVAGEMGNLRADYADGWREASGQMIAGLRERADTYAEGDDRG